MRSLVATLRQWPRRRWVAAALAAPTLAAVLFGVGNGPDWWAWILMPVTGGLAGLIVASYLAGPGSRRLIEVGCSPCAAVAGGAVGFAILVRVGAPDSALGATIAMVMLVAALRQRLADSVTCQTSRRSPGDADRTNPLQGPIRSMQ